MLAAPGCGLTPLPGISEPTGQAWLRRHCSLVSGPDCQHIRWRTRRRRRRSRRSRLAFSSCSSHPPLPLSLSVFVKARTCWRAHFQGQRLHLPVVFWSAKIAKCKATFLSAWKCDSVSAEPQSLLRMFCHKLSPSVSHGPARSQTVVLLRPRWCHYYWFPGLTCDMWNQQQLNPPSRLYLVN